MDKTRFKDGGAPKRFGDLTPEEFIDLMRQANQPATKALGPKMTPADPLDSSLERLRVACVDAAQRIGDAQLSKEIEGFATRIRSLAGIQGAASTTLTDNQAPMPTTKATEPLDHFVRGLSAPVTKEHQTGGIGNMFAGVYGWNEGRPVE